MALRVPGLIYILNNLGDKWSGTSVKTQWTNQKFIPIAWDGHDTAIPMNARRMLTAIQNFRLPRVATAFKCRLKRDRQGGLRY